MNTPKCFGDYCPGTVSYDRDCSRCGWRNACKHDTRAKVMIKSGGWDSDTESDYIPEEQPDVTEDSMGPDHPEERCVIPGTNTTLDEFCKSGMLLLPSNVTERKALPVATGFVDYFPDAMVAVAELSRVGNEQHNPGKPLFWDRSKSGDESDALMRHFLERGTIDTDGIRHSAKVAWRAMALLQKELESIK